MNDSNTVVLTALGIMGTMVAVLVWVIKIMFNKIVPLIEDGNAVIGKITPRLEKGNDVIHKLVATTDANTKATKMADTYLRERNGRDSEFHEELMLAVKEIPAQIIASAKITAKVLKETPSDQHIDTQNVKQQIVQGAK